MSVSSEEFAHDQAAQKIWGLLNKSLDGFQGTAYYKYPLLKEQSDVPPDFIVLIEGQEPLIIKSIPYSIGEIVEIKDDVWVINTHPIDSPVLHLEDLLFGLKGAIDNQRRLRELIKPTTVLAFPFVKSADFRDKFQNINFTSKCIWQEGTPVDLLTKIEPPLSNDEFKLLRSVVQGATPLIKKGAALENTSDKIGDALYILDRRITALDDEQEKAAIQIAPGIQVIKGLAGTGKTVLLAMKAAHIHMRFPDRKILFTFHTQSLYNQTKSLISQFYSSRAKREPNWNIVEVKHAWGGGTRAGVYSELSKKLELPTLDLVAATRISRSAPFAACCASLLTKKIEPEYSFILVDEAQDFPKEFFRVLYELALPPKAIYVAFDELQNLSSLRNSNPSEWFGKDEKGEPRFSPEGDYPGPIEKEIILQKSYRCPRTVLMLAHAVGLGLNSPKGCVQIVPDEASWNSLGYQIVSGACQKGQKVKIFRSEENSPNPVDQIYTGKEELVTVKSFPNVHDELKDTSESIIKSVKEENVPPEEIVVVSLATKSSLISIQKILWASGINSIIPGVLDQASEFRERGNVTLANVFRAKGNEAGLVYVINAEQMGSYANEIEARNKAFTAISRAKGFVRISGSGPKMEAVSKELLEILNRIPYFEFIFPDPKAIPSLTALATSRRKEISKAKKSIRELAALDIGALQEQDFDSLKLIKERIEEALRDSSK